MIKDCTHPSLIALLYNEMDALDALDALELLDADPSLSRTYDDLQETHQMLNTVCIKPSLKTLNSVLNYSKQ